MPAEEEILINTILAGEREFVAGATAEAAAVGEIGEAAELTGRRFERTAKRGFLMNQALFTMRRVAYAGTLALLTLGGAALKFGWDYTSAMQQARVALRPVFEDQQALTDELNTLFDLARFTPLRFKDITIAFRQMYGAFHPLGISVETTNTTLKAIIDALAFVGRDSPGALNRVAIALQHMAYQGRLTGQTTLQLARDGLPIYAALQKELGLTADQMHHIGQLGIPVQTALDAINKYIETTPGYQDAARRQALKSLSGLLSTIYDTSAQLFGLAEKGLFRRVQSDLVGTLNVLDEVSKAITRDHANLEGVMKILDRHITPESHGFLMFWHQVRADIHLAWMTIAGLTSGLTHSATAWGFVYGILVVLHGVLAGTAFNAQLLGHVLGIMLPLWILWHTYLKLDALWLGIMKAVEVEATVATRELTFAQFLLALTTGRYAITLRLATAATWVYITATTALTVAMERARIMAATLWLVMELNPLFLIITAIVLLVAGLVILYFKWKAFHNLVDDTWHWIRAHWYILAPTILGPFLMIAVIITHLRELRNAVTHTVNWIIHEWHRIPGHGGIGSVATSIAKGAANLLIPPGLPHLAGGGTILSPGWTLVGERGPELLSLPAGATVHPDWRQHPPFSLRDVVGSAGHRDNRPIQIQLVADGRVLAEVVTFHQQTAEARS